MTPGYATDVAPTDLARAEDKFDPRLTVGMAAAHPDVSPSHNGFDFRRFEKSQ